MYDDILGPVDEKPEEVEINIKPKKKTGKANKGTTLKANLAPKAPSAPTSPDDETCEHCGNNFEDCECEELEELDLSDLEELLEKDDEEDPWMDVDDGKCDTGECDTGGCLQNNPKQWMQCGEEIEKEDPCNGEQCHDCKEDCMYSFLT